jgi:AIPR protein
VIDLIQLFQAAIYGHPLALALKDLGYEYKRKRDDQAATTADVITSSVAAEAIMAVWRKRPHAAKFRRSKLFGEFYPIVFSDELQAAHLIVSVLVFRIVENERKRPRQKRPRFVPYASHFLAMVVGDLLLQRVGLQRTEIDHTNVDRVRATLEAERSKLYEQAVARLGVVLRGLGVAETTPLQRVAAQFRRGDLLEPLQEELAKLVRPKKVETTRPEKKPASERRPRKQSRGSNPRGPASVRAATSDLNKNEEAVLRALAASPEGLHLANLALKAFPTVKPVQSNSWSRNSVRRPLKLRLVEKVGKGTYAITNAGRAALKPEKAARRTSAA